MTDAIFLDLQNPLDLESVQVLALCGEMCHAAFQDAYQAVSVKTEVSSEKDPLALTFPGIKTEPEVSCVPLSMLGGFHKYKYPRTLDL